MRSEPSHGESIMRGGSRDPVGLLLFDLDETLCDYGGARELRLRTAFEAALQSIPLDRTRPAVEDLIAASLAVHPHAADHFEEILCPHGVTPEAARAAVAWYRSNRFHGLTLFEETRDTLSELRAADPARPIGLITNGPAEGQRAKISLLGIEELIDFAVVSGEFGVEKPDPSIFHEALRLGGGSPGSTIFVGDSPEHDIAGAVGVGITAVWINRTGAPWTFGDPRPDATITNLWEVPELL